MHHVHSTSGMALKERQHSCLSFEESSNPLFKRYLLLYVSKMKQAVLLLSIALCVCAAAAAQNAVSTSSLIDSIITPKASTMSGYRYGVSAAERELNRPLSQLALCYSVQQHCIKEMFNVTRVC